MRCVSISNAEQYREVQESSQQKDYQLPSCQFHDMTFVFGLQSSGELTCADPSNHVRSCAYETCECSLDLIRKMAKFRDSGAFQWANSRAEKDLQTCGYTNQAELQGDRHKLKTFQKGKMERKGIIENRK